MLLHGRFWQILFMVVFPAVLAGCSGAVLPLSPDNVPVFGTQEVRPVALCIRPVIRSTDGVIYQRDALVKELDFSARYSVPLLTVLDRTLSRRVDEVFTDHTNDPTRSCQLEMSVPLASFKHQGAGQLGNFTLEVETKLKGPNGQVLERKRFRTCKSSFFDGQTVPDAIWQAADDVARQAVKHYANNGMVLSLAETLGAPAATAAVGTPPSRSGAADAYLPRRPESAGSLSTTELSRVSGENRWRALLIGISDYSSSKGFAPSLNGIPTQDVLELKRVLEADYGFGEIVTLLDRQATRRGILGALSELHATSSSDDNILIYYAGHGLLPSHGVGVWVPSDARTEEDGISNAEIKDRVANLPAKRVLVVSDSCFSGSFLTRAIGLTPKKKIVQTANTSEKISKEIASNRRSSRQVLTSGNFSPVPNAGTGAYRANSPFAGSLLAALKSAQAGAVLSLTDLYTDLSYNMQSSGATSVAQAPQRGTLPGDAGGEFFLVRR